MNNKFDKRSIALMTKLAIYDKHKGNSDRKITGFYRHDYVYRKNIISRLGAFFGGLFVLGLYLLNLIFTTEQNIFEFDLERIAVNIAIYFGVIFVISTIISSVVATAEYNRAQNRQRKYFEMLKRLEILRERFRNEQNLSEQKEEETDLYYSSPNKRYSD